MRFDTPVYFRQTIRGEYDPDTGNYAPNAAKETKLYASVTSAGVNTHRLVYGEIKQGSLVIRLQNHYDEPFDRIRIGEGESAKFYSVDMKRPLRSKQIFVVSEVQ